MHFIVLKAFELLINTYIIIKIISLLKMKHQSHDFAL
jgi:hypothetical protein